jgi:spoIIIJ-associated protein
MAFILELEAKSVEKAVKLACEKLEIPREELNYDVISHGSSGIFGIGRSKKARIRVVLPEEEDESVPSEDLSTDFFNSGNDASADIKNHVQELIQGTFDQKQTVRTDREETHVRLGKEVLQRIVDTITSDATVTYEEDSGKILFNISGGNSAILIGRHGQTLDAMQSLVEKIVNKSNTERIRVQVDVEGYLENRKNNLIKHAERMAAKCKSIRRPVTVGNMNAHDRRIVHIALRGDNKVRTHSTGEGYLRKLVIFPRKNSYSKRRQS